MDDDGESEMDEFEDYDSVTEMDDDEGPSSTESDDDGGDEPGDQISEEEEEYEGEPKEDDEKYRDPPTQIMEYMTDCFEGDYYSPTGFFDFDGKELVYVRENWKERGKTVDLSKLGAPVDYYGKVGRQVRMRFSDVVDAGREQIFTSLIRRRVAEDEQARVTLADIKDTALYTSAFDVPEGFIRFFYTRAADRLLRALAVYFQYFMTIKRALADRQALYRSKLGHPVTDMREAIWAQNLADMRYVIGREYSEMVIGKGETGRFHHVSKRTHRSQPKRELLTFELFHKFAVRIMELTMGQLRNPTIKDEMDRLFRVDPYKGRYRNGGRSELDSRSREVLEMNYVTDAPVECKAAIMREMRRPNRDPRLAMLGLRPIPNPSERLASLQLAYTCPEELLKECNVQIGILGDDRDRHPPLFLPVSVDEPLNWHMCEAKQRMEQVDEWVREMTAGASDEGRGARRRGSGGKENEELGAAGSRKSGPSPNNYKVFDPARDTLNLPVAKRDYTKPYNFAKASSADQAPPDKGMKNEQSRLELWLTRRLLSERYKPSKKVDEEDSSGGPSPARKIVLDKEDLVIVADMKKKGTYDAERLWEEPKKRKPSAGESSGQPTVTYSYSSSSLVRSRHSVGPFPEEKSLPSEPESLQSEEKAEEAGAGGLEEGETEGVEREEEGEEYEEREEYEECEEGYAEEEETEDESEQLYADETE